MCNNLFIFVNCINIWFAFEKTNTPSVPKRSDKKSNYKNNKNSCNNNNNNNNNNNKKQQQQKTTATKTTTTTITTTTTTIGRCAHTLNVLYLICFFLVAIYTFDLRNELQKKTLWPGVSWMSKRGRGLVGPKNTQKRFKLDKWSNIGLDLRWNKQFLWDLFFWTF